MPIIVRDFTWEETEKIVFISVPLKAVKTTSVDVFSTEQYIKVSYPPYLFECFLFGAVLDQNSAAQIGNGMILFKLEKQEPAIWGQLQQSGITEDKEKQRELREIAQQRSIERSKEEKITKAEKKRELDKFGVKEQMKIEEKDRQRIESEKEKERQDATMELEKWKEHQSILADQERQKHAELQKTKKEDARKKQNKKKSQIFQEEAGDSQIRQTGKIAVSFTHRDFPTPSRESIAQDEEAWLKKQADTRKIKELADSDLSEEERNPVWLRDKGNEFFKAENYQAAANVYSHAIRLDFKMPALYSNRAACHLKIGNYIKAAEDATRALDLLTPPVPQNAASRVKAHIRRGTAYCKLELYAEGLQDYEAALKIDSNNEQLKSDALQIRQIIQGTIPS